MAISILCVHGVNHGDIDPDLEGSWSKAICNGLVAWNPETQGTITYDFFKCYNTFLHTPAAIKNKTFVSLGLRVAPPACAENLPCGSRR